MNYDEYMTGQSDPTSPINEQELPELTELEQQQEWNAELISKLKKAKFQINELIDYAQASENNYLFNKLKNIKL